MNVRVLPDGLHSLNLGDNLITDIEWRALKPGLRSVQLQHNRLTTAHLRGVLPPGLQVLILSYNLLGDVDVCGVPNSLKKLGLNNNQITGLDLTMLPPGLIELLLMGNHLDPSLMRLPVNGFPKGLSMDIKLPCLPDEEASEWKKLKNEEMSHWGSMMHQEKKGREEAAKKENDLVGGAGELELRGEQTEVESTESSTNFEITF